VDAMMEEYQSIIKNDVSQTKEKRCGIFVGLRTFVGLSELLFPTTCIVDPGLIYFRVPTNPKTIGPSGKPEGNTVHIMHCTISPEIALNGWLRHLQPGIEYEIWDLYYEPFILTCVTNYCYSLLYFNLYDILSLYPNNN
jgi:hypothetical protein